MSAPTTKVGELRLGSPREETTATPAEFAAIAHLRGWCHNVADCDTCRWEDRARAAERSLRDVKRTLDSIIIGG